MQNEQTAICITGGGTNSLLLVKMTNTPRGKEKE